MAVAEDAGPEMERSPPRHRCQDRPRAVHEDGNPEGIDKGHRVAESERPEKVPNRGATPQNHVLAVVEHGAVHRIGEREGAASDPPARLHQRHAHARGLEVQRRLEPGETGSHHHRSLHPVALFRVHASRPGRTRKAGVAAPPNRAYYEGHFVTSEEVWAAGGMAWIFICRRMSDIKSGTGRFRPPSRWPRAPRCRWRRGSRRGANSRARAARTICGGSTSRGSIP